MMTQASQLSARAVKAMGQHAETLLSPDFGFVILTVPRDGGAGHIASNMDNTNLLRALRNALGAIEPVAVQR